MAINAGPLDPFNHAISFVMNCAVWQIVPTVLNDMMADSDRERATRIMRAMLEMVKLDIAGLKKAYDNG